MTQPEFWIGTSWKMNKTLAQAAAFAKGLIDADAAANSRIQRFVVPPFTSIREVAALLSETSVKVGVQNSSPARISTAFLSGVPLWLVQGYLNILACCAAVI